MSSVAARYKRVSTTKQEEHGISLETQQEKLEAYCKIKDFEDVKDYMDVGSGRNADRSDFQRMMADVESGKIKHVIVLRLDRLTRSISDLDKLLKMFQDFGCTLHSATESLDTSTANGRLMVNLIGLFAQWESETISERVTINMQTLAERGVWMSSIPFGFELGEDKKLILNEAEANIVREGFRLVLEGNSFGASERLITKKYNLPWSKDFLSRKLKYATTVGDIERNGKTIENTHVGIITKAERDKLLTILKGNLSGRRFIAREDIFSRRVICPQCEAVMSVNAYTSNDYETFNYRYVCDQCYRQKRPAVSVSEKLLEEAFLDYLSLLHFADFEDTLPTQNDNQKEIALLRKQLKNLDAKKDKIQRAWLNDMMSDDDLKTYKKEIDEEMFALEEGLSKLSVVKEQMNVAELKILKDLFEIHYAEFTRNEKRSFIQQHIQKIHFQRELIKGFKQKYEVRVTNVEFF